MYKYTICLENTTENINRLYYLLPHAKMSFALQLLTRGLGWDWDLHWVVV